MLKLKRKYNKYELDKVINYLLSLNKEGKFSQIIAEEKKLKKYYQQSPKISNLLGVINLLHNQFEDSVKYFEKAVILSPNSFVYHNNLGLAYYNNSNFEDSINSFREALRIKPNFSDAYANLGVSLKKINNYTEAIRCFKTAIKINPNNTGFYIGLGEIYYLEKKIEKAIENFKRAIKIKQDCAEAYYNLGVIFHNKGRFNTSILNYNKAIKLKPNYPEAYYNLGNLLKEMGKYQESEKNYEKAIAFKPEFPEAYNNLGIILNKQLRTEEAKNNFMKATILNPDYAEAYNNLGTSLIELGKFEPAIASLNKSITLKPNLAQAHRHLSYMRKYDTKKDKHFLKMLELYQDKSISRENLCHINFGLAKACEDLGNFKEAYKHYREGNALAKKHLKYDLGEDKEMFRLIKKSHPYISQNSLDSNDLEKDIIPIFIFGMPRSGTTLVEQIISSHPHVTGAGELPFVHECGELLINNSFQINKESLKKFRKNYLKKIKTFSKGNLFITDKMPHNFLYLGLVVAALPEAKLVHVKRDPRAVCWSNYKQYFESKYLGYSYDLDNTISYYRFYEDLMNFWRIKLSKNFYNLNYEQLTINQEDETRNLIDYLDLVWDAKCLSPHKNFRSVTTSSNIQVRKKIYQNSSEQWKKYASFLNCKLDDLLTSI